MRLFVDVGDVDWALLREQIEHLSDVLEVQNGEFADTVEGVLSLLMDIQHQAALQIGYEQVFGPENNEQ